MSDNNSNQIKSFEKIFNEYKIQLNTDTDKINIQIQKNNNIYNSIFNLQYFQKFQLTQNFTIEEIIQFIKDLIEQNNIKIEENEMDLKLILIHKMTNQPNIELIIDNKNIISKELIQKLINEIKFIKDENKLIKENYDKLNEKINIIENENNELKKKISLIEKSNKDTKLENEQMNEIKEKIKLLEKFIKDKNQIQLTSCNLKNINSILPHNNLITSVSSFPSGNLISVSADKSINIYDINLKILQNIKNAHNGCILHIEIKDENNFSTCSDDKNIKLWIKKENKFINNQIISKAHEDGITKVIYCSNGNLISCSQDKNIKIWKENYNNNNYENIKILTHTNKICSILFLEDKNILISSGEDGTKFWNLNKEENDYNNINCIKYFEDTYCIWNHGLCRLDEDRIIVKSKGKNNLKVISILKKEIIKEINHPFQCFAITLIKDKGIFLVGGKSKDIMIYRNDNYECIQTIKDAHDGYIFGFVELIDKSVASFSGDKKIKIWCF